MKSVIRKILITAAVALVLLATATVAGLTLFRDNLILFLSVNQPVSAEYLVVEGWVDDMVLDSAARIFESDRYKGIIVTGSTISSDYLMSTNGLLEYTFDDGSIQLDKGDSIGVCLRGTAVSNIYPFFVVLLNGKTYFEGFATDEWKDHYIRLDSSLLIHDLGIYFGNDEFRGDEDRNLIVRHVSLGGRVIPARSPYSLRYSSKDEFKTDPSPTHFHSVAGMSAYKLEQKGIPGERIIVLPSPEGERHRTLTSAWVVRDWMGKTGLPASTPVNILSESIHSRRTYIVYRALLEGRSNEIGIVSISLHNERYLGFSISNKGIARELAGSFYYRFLVNKRRLLKRIVPSAT